MFQFNNVLVLRRYLIQQFRIRQLICWCLFWLLFIARWQKRLNDILSFIPFNCLTIALLLSDSYLRSNPLQSPWSRSLLVASHHPPDRLLMVSLPSCVTHTHPLLLCIVVFWSRKAKIFSVVCSPHSDSSESDQLSHLRRSGSSERAESHRGYDIILT